MTTQVMTVRGLIEHLSQFEDTLEVRIRSQEDIDKTIDFLPHQIDMFPLAKSLAREHGNKDVHPLCVVIG